MRGARVDSRWQRCLCATLIIASAVVPCAEAQESNRRYDFVTPRTLYRHNPERVIEKEAVPQRDRRFLQEPGFERLPQSAKAVSVDVGVVFRDSPQTPSLGDRNASVVAAPQLPVNSSGANLSTPTINVKQRSLSQERHVVREPSDLRALVGVKDLKFGPPVLSSDLPKQALPPERPPFFIDSVRPNVENGRFSIDQIIHNAMTSPLLGPRPVVRLSIGDLLTRTLQHAKNVQVLRVRPVEDRQFVQQEYGEFDWAAFFENRIGRMVSPVGQRNQFANANQSEIKADRFQFRGGLRKQTVTGGQFEVREELQFLDENSGQLNPADQAISQLSVVFSQELLRDGGRDIVLSQALIASYQADRSHALAVAQIGDRLQEVLNEYWALFENRSNFFIQAALTGWAQDTLRQLEDRRRIDAEENTIEQARALLLEAQANLIEAKIQVQISQDRLFRLVNDPSIDPEQVEIITSHPPAIGSLQFDPRTELETAIQNRGEIYDRLAAIAEASLEYQVSLNQLLPKLTVSIESSLNGLEGNREAFRAKANAINTQPTVEANFNLEFFLSNRFAKAANRQTQLRLRRLQFEYEDQIEALRLDVSQAIRTLSAANSNIGLRAQTLVSRRRELEYLRLRREVIPQAGANVSLLLEQFFQALNRLVASQQAFIASKANIQRALVDLQRAKGMLIHSSEVPTDQFVPVPSIPRALKAQMANKRNYVTKARRVVQSSDARPLRLPVYP